MEHNEIYVTFLYWGDQGEPSPILIVKEDENSIYIFRITSKNHNPHYYDSRYPILDWKQAGLKEPSYVRVDKPYQIAKKYYTFSYIGKLTPADSQRLKQFYIKYRAQHQK